MPQMPLYIPVSIDKIKILNMFADRWVLELTVTIGEDQMTSIQEIPVEEMGGADPSDWWKQ